MADTLNETKVNGTDNDNQEKTFTQEEVDAIVMDRLWKERSKHSDYADLKAKAEELDKIKEANKTELEKEREKATNLEKELESIKKTQRIRDTREIVSKELNIPIHLLNGETEDECRAQAEAILEFVGTQNGYPSVKDSGEMTQTMKKDAVGQFEDWFNASVN